MTSFRLNRGNRRENAQKKRTTRRLQGRRTEKGWTMETRGKTDKLGTRINILGGGFKKLKKRFELLAQGKTAEKKLKGCFIKARGSREQHRLRKRGGGETSHPKA